MTVRLAADGTIELLDDCASEDAEVLLRHLLDSPVAAVDWRACMHMHAAVLQVLLAAKPAVKGLPGGAFLREHVAFFLKNLQQ